MPIDPTMLASSGTAWPRTGIVSTAGTAPAHSGEEGHPLPLGRLAAGAGALPQAHALVPLDHGREVCGAVLHGLEVHVRKQRHDLVLLGAGARVEERKGRTPCRDGRKQNGPSKNLAQNTNKNGNKRMMITPKKANGMESTLGAPPKCTLFHWRDFGEEKKWENF